MKDLNAAFFHSRTFKIVVGIALLALITALSIVIGNDYPSVAEVYKPGKATIETVEQRDVRQNKRTEKLHFYSGSFRINGKTFSTSFATKSRLYEPGDTVRLLYDPTMPASHVVYDERSRVVHIAGGDVLQGVNIDFNDIVQLFDSLDRGVIPDQ
ncbi:MAG: hypothetical protein AB7H80_00190 [Candidatus Kapaibacterium sp.]